MAVMNIVRCVINMLWLELCGRSKLGRVPEHGHYAT